MLTLLQRESLRDIEACLRSMQGKHKARPLYAHDPFGVALDDTVYALDSTTIDLCLALFPWAHYQRDHGAVKIHTLLDLRGSIPAFINITDGKVADVNIMDRGYHDFSRLYALHQVPYIAESIRGRSTRTQDYVATKRLRLVRTDPSVTRSYCVSFDFLIQRATSVLHS